MFSFVGVVSADDHELGNDLIDRAYLDTYANFSIVDTETYSENGLLYKLEYYAGRDSMFKFLLVDESKEVVWKSDAIYPDSVNDVNTYILGTPVAYESGWTIGFWFQGNGVIPFDYNGAADPLYYTPNGNGEPNVGDIITTQGTTKRDYSYRAYIEEYDSDNDGVVDSKDYCSETTSDQFELGTNRWMYDGSEWVTNSPNDKGPKVGFTMEETLGCGCNQIIDHMEAITGFEFEGHRKYGCSKSLVQDWISGMYYIGTYKVPVTNGDGIDTDFDSVEGTQYYVEAEGTYRFAPWGAYGIADAEWAYRNDGYAEPIAPHMWTVGENSYPSIVGLDVQIDSTNIDWGDYSEDHMYSTMVTGTGNPLNFAIYDSAYGDNYDIGDGMHVHVYGVLH